MFGKEKYALETSDQMETIIGPSVSVKGNLAGQGNVRVEGAVEGSLHTKGDVRVGEGAKIQANIKAHNVSVAGEVQGAIKAAEQVMLRPTAKVFGDIEAGSLVIEQGALFSGKCIMAKDDKNTETEKVIRIKSKEKEIKESETLPQI